MTTDALPIPSSIRLPEEAAGTWLETLHGWVTTVDHKRLGLMYIGLALLFLVIGGVEATISFRRRSSIACSRCTAPP